jgi:hypothetical protein
VSFRNGGLSSAVQKILWQGTDLPTAKPRAASWTAVAERSGDTAFARAEHERTMDNFRPHGSGVALRFPLHSKTSRNWPLAFRNHAAVFQITLNN